MAKCVMKVVNNIVEETRRVDNITAADLVKNHGWGYTSKSMMNYYNIKNDQRKAGEESILYGK